MDNTDRKFLVMALASLSDAVFHKLHSNSALMASMSEAIESGEMPSASSMRAAIKGQEEHKKSVKEFTSVLEEYSNYIATTPDSETTIN